MIINKQDIKYILNKLNQIKVPLYIILGNHDIRTIPQKKLENMLSYHSSSFFVNINGYHLVFVNVTANELASAKVSGIIKIPIYIRKRFEVVRRRFKSK